MINQQTSANEAVATGQEFTRRKWHTPVLSVFKAEEAAHGQSWNNDNGALGDSAGHS
jgi:hypothetical protein